MTQAIKRILLLGASGVIGSELRRRLPSDVPIVTASRGRTSGSKPDRVLDVEDPAGISSAVAEGDLVIDASAPFSVRPRRALDAARAVLQSGGSWVDLSADRAGVQAIAELDALAKERGRFAIAGAGLFPGLTAPFVRSACQEVKRVNEIHIGWAPGAGLAFGPASFEDLIQRAGRQVPMLLGGELSQRQAFGDRRAFFHPPPFGEIFSYNFDGPDLDLYCGPGFKSASVRISIGTKPMRQRWALRHLSRTKAGSESGALARRITRLQGRPKAIGGVLTAIVRGLDPASNPKETRRAFVFSGSGAELVASPATALAKLALTGSLPPGARPALADLTESHLEAELSAAGIVLRRGSLGGWQPAAR